MRIGVKYCPRDLKTALQLTRCSAKNQAAFFSNGTRAQRFRGGGIVGEALRIDGGAIGRQFAQQITQVGYRKRLLNHVVYASLFGST